MERIKEIIIIALQGLGIIAGAAAAVFILWLTLWTAYDLGFTM